MLRRQQANGRPWHTATAAATTTASRSKATHYSDTIKNFSQETDSEYDVRHRPTYAKKRQQDAIAFAIKEKEQLQKLALIKLNNEEYEQKKGERLYQRSIERFPQYKKVDLSQSGSGDNRIIQTWENVWYNWIRYYFTSEMLIAKDRYGNRFISKWNFYRARQEVRMCFRVDKSMKHMPYGHDYTDHQQWTRWLKSHRGEPPTVAEEEFRRESTKESAGPIVHEHESAEDAMARAMANVPEMGGLYDDKDFQIQDQDSYHRTVKPARVREQEKLDPEEEMADRVRAGGVLYGSDPATGGGTQNSSSRPTNGVSSKGKNKGTWHQVFVRPDLFYNEEEVDVLRSEVSHMFRSMEWQELEYKRQVRQAKAQKPFGMPEKTLETGDIEAGQKAAVPLTMYWERLDKGIPYHDAVPDLSSPELERLRLEADQLDDQRLAIRLELGLTDLGDMREGRPPIDKGDSPYMKPITARYKPRVWDESWGSETFRGWD